jgi:hypothetical protein
VSKIAHAGERSANPEHSMNIHRMYIRNLGLAVVADNRLGLDRIDSCNSLCGTFLPTASLFRLSHDLSHRGFRPMRASMTL